MKTQLNCRTALVAVTLILSLCCTRVAAKTCPPNFFGYAANFNVFLLGNPSANSNNSDLFTFDLSNGEVEGASFPIVVKVEEFV